VLRYRLDKAFENVFRTSAVLPRVEHDDAEDNSKSKNIWQL
jgi:hypothetical protein